MDWMKIYCLVWLVISAMFALEAAATFNLDDLAHQRKGDNPKDFFDSYDNEEEAEMAFSLSNRLPELYDDLNEALSFMSVDAMQNSMLGLSGFLLLLDTAGFLLAYQNIHRSELHLIFIAIIGVNMFRAKVARERRRKPYSPKNFVKAMTMGFCNPAAPAFMLGFFAIMRMDMSEQPLFVPILAILAVAAGSASYWYLISRLTAHFGNKFNYKVLLIVNRIAGAGVFFFGIYLLAKGAGIL